MLIVTINDIHAKHIRFDVSIIYTITVHCNVSRNHSYTTASHAHRHFYHTSYTVPPVVESIKLTGDDRQLKKKKTLEGLKGTYTRYGLPLQVTITRGRMPNCFRLRKATSLL